MLCGSAGTAAHQQSPLLCSNHATVQTVSKYIEAAVCAGLPDNFKQMCKQVRQWLSKGAVQCSCSPRAARPSNASLPVLHPAML